MHAWNRAAYSLGRLGGVSTNNKVRLYFDGDSAFDDKFAAVDAATKRTWLEIYMLEPDAVGVRMLGKLE
jgi:phosphatidylserine/phosphatidylglycerophosphate/cardiolipin synthase-like enzyme